MLIQVFLKFWTSHVHLKARCLVGARCFYFNKSNISLMNALLVLYVQQQLRINRWMFDSPLLFIFFNHYIFYFIWGTLFKLPIEFHPKISFKRFKGCQ